MLPIIMLMIHPPTSPSIPSQPLQVTLQIWTSHIQGTMPLHQCILASRQNLAASSNVELLLLKRHRTIVSCTFCDASRTSRFRPTMAAVRRANQRFSTLRSRILRRSAGSNAGGDDLLRASRELSTVSTCEYARAMQAHPDTSFWCC